jgi:Fic family protein
VSYTPHFQYTAALVRAAGEIGSYQATVAVLPLPLSVERQLRHEARVRVAHNSTWIENRSLALEEAAAVIANKALADPTRARTDASREVRNYFQALEFVDQRTGVACDEEFIRRLHAIIMRGSRGGRPREHSDFRRENLRIGNFVYVPPAWEDVPALMADLVAWATGPGLALPRFLYAAVLAYQFVTIHPFQDGNGRTCRALATWALRGPDDEQAIDPIGLLSVEEFYAADLAGYYEALQMGLHFSYYDADERGSRSAPDLTPWLDYFACALARSARQVRQMVAERFRAAHGAVLADPVVDYPRTFRRLLIHMPDPTASFGPGEVVAWLQVSDRTARTWLKEWHAQDLIQPQRPGVQRIHAWVLAARVAAVVVRQ